VRLSRVVALFAVALVACGVPTDREARFANRDEVPFGLLDRPPPTTTTTEVATPQETTVTVCLRSGNQIVPVTRSVAGSTALGDVTELLDSAPTAEEREANLDSVLFGEGFVGSVTVGGGVATVDLLASFQDRTGTDQVLAITQIVCTLTGQPGVGQVSMTLEGASIEIPRGDGSLTAGAVSRDDYVSLIAPREPADATGSG